MDPRPALLVHELSNQLSREELAEVKAECPMPCPIAWFIAALRQRIALKQTGLPSG